MKSRSLLDTDWIIDYLKGQEEVVERLSHLWAEGLAISIISCEGPANLMRNF